ncbi:MAG TPA: hypothetical protein VJT16_20385 [Streptosporangiaceae bacterium]|nr:hypothetical protein [Streptosporangiaceae bacterium]
MTQVRLTVSDLARTRFAFSPLGEVGESLYLLSSGSIYGLHQGWYADVSPRLAAVDMDLLLAVVPPRPWIADFLFIGAERGGTAVDLAGRAAAASDRRADGHGHRRSAHTRRRSRRLLVGGNRAALAGHALST